MNKKTKTKMKTKMIYVPPTVSVTRVTLERTIAAHSPIQQVNLNDWVYEDFEDDVNNNLDVWLNL